MNPAESPALFKRFSPMGTRRARARFLWKKYSWLAAVRGAEAAKRAIDVLVSSVLLVALAPFLLLVAASIKVTDGGPVLYWQDRVGRHGRLFRFPKFRSMVVGADSLRDRLAGQSLHGCDGITFKIRCDPRVTRLGRVLRKLSIDELPQLWCVLKGDMSLVGPRPPIPGEVARYTPAARRRLEVRPGLTCLWQVSGRGDIPFEGQLALDVAYIESRSLWTDLKILGRTIPAVIRGDGAY